MRKRVLLITLATALLLFVPAVVFALKPHQTTVQAPVYVALNADVIFTKVNDERVKNGLKPLIRDARLDATAQARADDMVTRKYFSHFDPIDGHKMVNDKTNLGGVTFCTISSENLNQVSGNANQNDNAVSSWLGSKPHHDAILDTRYSLTGIAVNGDIVVQHFCIAK